nr:MAG TPA: hypothetical protein [Caudoviricetes sp.]
MFGDTLKTIQGTVHAFFIVYISAAGPKQVINYQITQR